MEKTLEIKMEEQNARYSHLLARNSILIGDEWYVPGQVALDIIAGRITE